MRAIPGFCLSSGIAVIALAASGCSALPTTRALDQKRQRPIAAPSVDAAPTPPSGDAERAFDGEVEPDPWGGPAPRPDGRAIWAGPLVWTRESLPCERKNGKVVPPVRKGWKTLMRDPSSSLYALSVVASNPDDVWFVGESGIILHTADHGATFDRCRLASGEHLLSVWAASKDDVWILGELHVFRIENRTTVATLPLELKTHCGSPRNTIYGRASNDVWLANGSLLHTTDRGVTWKRVRACYRQQGDVCASEVGGAAADLIVDCPFSAARSGDSGTTWSSTGWPPHVEEQMHVAASDDDLWVVGQDTAIIGRSVDHGATWSTERIDGVGRESEPIFDVGALGHGWAWLTRRDGIWMRRGRLPWRREFPVETIRALGGPNEKDVWAIGDHGLVLHRE